MQKKYCIIIHLKIVQWFKKKIYSKKDIVDLTILSCLKTNFSLKRGVLGRGAKVAIASDKSYLGGMYFF